MKHGEMLLHTAFETMVEELSLMSALATLTHAHTATPPQTKSLNIMPKTRKRSTRLHVSTFARISPLLSTLSTAWPLRMHKRPSDALPGYSRRSGAAHTRTWLASSAQG
ncbi:hypothetical protein ACHAW6_001472 [Cyclotella cf. meneghiniana]